MVGNAVRVMRVATDEVEEAEKNPVAIARGKKGGTARASKLSALKRREIATKAAEARWKRDQSSPSPSSEG